MIIILYDEVEAKMGKGKGAKDLKNRLSKARGAIGVFQNKCLRRILLQWKDHISTEELLEKQG